MGHIGESLMENSRGRHFWDIYSQVLIIPKKEDIDEVETMAVTIQLVIYMVRFETDLD